jgi:hypothetical protein
MLNFTSDEKAMLLIFLGPAKLNLESMVNARTPRAERHHNEHLDYNLGIVCSIYEQAKKGENSDADLD